jgi:hypothetical protein
MLTREYLVILVLVNIADSKARDSIYVRHSPVGVQEYKRSIIALLSIYADNTKANTLIKVIVQSNVLGKVRAGIKSIRALVVINYSSNKSIFKDLINIGLRTVETSSGIVIGKVNTILIIKVDHSNNTSNINALKVINISSILR